MYKVKKDTIDIHVHGHKYTHVCLNSLLKYIDETYVRRYGIWICINMWYKDAPILIFVLM